MPVPKYLRGADGQDKETFYMKGMQFPIINNSATTSTGHKLQGKTHQYLVVQEKKNPRQQKQDCHQNPVEQQR